MKKYITVAGLCLVYTVSNASEFACTISKMAYITALDPLVPQLVKEYKKDNKKFFMKTEKALKPLTITVYKNCEYIADVKALHRIINELSTGAIEFSIAKRAKK